MQTHSALVVPQVGGSRQRVRLSMQHQNGQNSEFWARKWQDLLKNRRNAPADFAEFDRLVRSVLNRISSENARRLLPLGPTLRGFGEEIANDFPQWWAARFVALMMGSYLQVIHTNRFARTLEVRSADNILPTYIDTVAPLLKRSPRLVAAITSWFAEQLDWHEISWPTTRLILLAAYDKRDRDVLPAISLGRLPADLLRRRILTFLHPPFLHSSCLGLMNNAGGEENSNSNDSELTEGKKDIIAVLVHFIVFTPSEIWPQISAFAFSLAENSLRSLESQHEVQVQDYLAASVLAAIAQRMDMQLTIWRNESCRDHSLRDFVILTRLITRLRTITEVRRRSSKLTTFVDCRTQVALDNARRVQETFQGQAHNTIPMAAT